MVPLKDKEIREKGYQHSIPIVNDNDYQEDRRRYLDTMIIHFQKKTQT